MPPNRATRSNFAFWLIQKKCVLANRVFARTWLITETSVFLAKTRFSAQKNAEMTRIPDAL